MIYPSMEVKDVGYEARFTCASNGKLARWFFFMESSLPGSVVQEGTWNEMLIIDKVTYNNIGRYCCYGYASDEMRHFFDCAYLNLKGSIEGEL